MELTKAESEELDLLRWLAGSNNVPISNEMHDRMMVLGRKQFHKSCSNLKCTGHQGSCDDKRCPKCGSELVNLSEQKGDLI